MIMTTRDLTYLMLLFLYNKEILDKKELINLKRKYASRMGKDESEIESVLDGL